MATQTILYKVRQLESEIYTTYAEDYDPKLHSYGKAIGKQSSAVSRLVSLGNCEMLAARKDDPNCFISGGRSVAGLTFSCPLYSIKHREGLFIKISDFNDLVHTAK